VSRVVFQACGAARVTTTVCEDAAMADADRASRLSEYESSKRSPPLK
jgi:hypothetical protein